MMIAADRKRWLVTSAVLAAATLIAIGWFIYQGRVWWCPQDDWSIVVLAKDSPHTSQHLLDPYSTSHVLHGVIFFGIFWLFRRQIPAPYRFLSATLLEIAWEMFENSPFVINRYREGTIALGYEGDSIANSLADVACCVVGYLFARKFGLWWSIALFVAIELTMLVLIRDNLTLNVLMLVWPIQAVRHWQAG